MEFGHNKTNTLTHETINKIINIEINEHKEEIENTIEREIKTFYIGDKWEKERGIYRVQAREKRKTFWPFDQSDLLLQTIYQFNLIWNYLSN